MTAKSTPAGLKLKQTLLWGICTRLTAQSPTRTAKGMTVASGLSMARERNEAGMSGTRQTFCGAPTSVSLKQPEAQAAALQRMRVGSTSAASGVKLTFLALIRARLKPRSDTVSLNFGRDVVGIGVPERAAALATLAASKVAKILESMFQCRRQ